MLFVVLMLVFGLLAYIPQFFLGPRRDLRMAMRHGMAGGFLFTGVDHFANGAERYVPMMPDLLAPWALELVWFSGAAEIAGALGLAVPLGVYARLGLPNLRYWAGIGIAVMLCFLVIANINVALQGAGYPGAGAALPGWYYWLRPALQPLIILWALYAAGVVGELRAEPCRNPATVHPRRTYSAASARMGTISASRCRRKKPTSTANSSAWTATLRAEA